jgi:hypothetical protein
MGAQKVGSDSLFGGIGVSSLPSPSPLQDVKQKPQPAAANLRSKGYRRWVEGGL